jgi:hypothetical protein
VEEGKDGVEILPVPLKQVIDNVTLREYQGMGVDFIQRPLQRLHGEPGELWECGRL